MYPLTAAACWCTKQHIVLFRCLFIKLHFEFELENRSIKKKDLVTWYTLGFHHVPHTEDWPVMSGHQIGIKLRLYNFFASNPAMSIRSLQPAPVVAK
jgi:hypothetical protein